MSDITFTKISLPYGWLGNMSRHRVFLEGAEWRTAEHAFQACRFGSGNPIRESLKKIKSPMEAKLRIKRHYDEMANEPLSEADLHLVRRVVKSKLDNNPELWDELHATNGCRLIEDVTRRQRGSGLFWGMALRDGQWVGENWLGRIWMEIRDA